MDEITALKNIVDFLVENTPLEQLPVADAIFVFGHIDPRIPKHAAHLFNLNKAPKIIVTGKGRKVLSGYDNEAEFFASILKDAGIPEHASILEKNAMNTLENVQFGMKASKDAGFHPKSLILVAVPPMLRRARATFKKQFPEIMTYGNSFEISLQEYKTWAKRLVEEFPRFQPYSEKGDIAEIKIPPKILESLNVLKNSSFLESSSTHFYSQ